MQSLFAQQMTPNGSVISFEGITGVGKSTQISLLREDLLAQGYRVHIKQDLMQFTDSSLGGAIRQILNKGADNYFQMGFPVAETLLICAKRSYEAETRLTPAL